MVHRRAAVVLFAACAPVTAPTALLPTPKALAIYVLEEPVELRVAPTWRGFRAAVVIKNNTTRGIVVSGCEPAVEREIDGTWQSVWLPACIGGWSYVPPGDSLVDELSVVAYSGVNWQPQADPRFRAGRYRLRFGIGWSQEGGIVTDLLLPEDRTSEVFVVVERDAGEVR